MDPRCTERADCDSVGEANSLAERSERGVWEPRDYDAREYAAEKREKGRCVSIYLRGRKDRCDGEGAEDEQRIAEQNKPGGNQQPLQYTPVMQRDDPEKMKRNSGGQGDQQSRRRYEKDEREEEGTSDARNRAGADASSPI